MRTNTFVKLPYEHERGIHCITTVMKNILNTHGISISEEICFGIGSGLGFTYTRGKSLNDFLVFGRSDDLELNVCEMLGIYAKLSQHSNSDIAFEKILRKVENGESIIVDLDISKLPYLTSALKWPETSSHGGHKAVFGGYDSSRDEVILYEYLWMEPRYIKREDFFQAWKSFHGLAPTCNLWYEFEFPSQPVPIDRAIRKGIEVNLHRMVSPWNKFHGLAGLKAFLREAPNWQYLFDNQARAKLAYASYISLEIGGTGKGAFRRMFSRFLRGASFFLEEDKLEEISKKYLNLSVLWSEIAILLEEGSRNPEKGLFSGNPVNEKLAEEIFNRESDAIHTLMKISKTWN